MCTLKNMPFSHSHNPIPHYCCKKQFLSQIDVIDLNFMCNFQETIKFFFLPSSFSLLPLTFFPSLYFLFRFSFLSFFLSFFFFVLSFVAFSTCCSAICFCLTKYYVVGIIPYQIIRWPNAFNGCNIHSYRCVLNYLSSFLLVLVHVAANILYYKYVPLNIFLHVSCTFVVLCLQRQNEDISIFTLLSNFFSILLAFKNF